MKTKAIIFDIDGTILYHTNRNPFNWRDLSGDKIIPEVLNLIKLLNTEYKIIFSTGRPDEVRSQTEEWLNYHLPLDVDYLLYMKKDDYYGKAVLHKQKNLKEIQKHFIVEGVFEDDTKCCEMYLEEGLFVYQPLKYKIK